MSRRAIALAVLSLAAVVIIAACQNYNFSPVGSCLIQPGSELKPLSGVTSADILFVIDDSGSMDSKQQSLAQYFSSFIQSVANAQKDRVTHGLDPFELHIAVTTSSVFAYDTTSPNFHTTYPSSFSGCTQGTAVANGPYPRGNFVRAGTNDYVLHFTKTLDWATWGTASVDPNLTHLVQEFVGTCPSGGLCSPSCTGTCTGGNIEVGSCGSGQEQHLEAARQAITKALAGQQPIQAGEWPHPSAKMIVVWVADEDDCSNPADYTAQTAAIQMTSYSTGNDTCVADKNTNPPDGTKEYPISGSSGYTAYFSSLGREFGAAFIVASNKCTQPATLGTYAPADDSHVQSPAACTGTAQYACSVAYAAGVRHLALATALRSNGFDVVEGSVCENFGPLLAAIADLVKPVDTLELPSVPASGEITVVRIVDANGNQRKVCTSSPPATTAAAGWWFVNDLTPTASTPQCDISNPVASLSTAATRCIYLNHTSGDCEANPGETYSAEYLGVIPAGGCTPASATKPVPGSPTAGQQACLTALGGVSADNWWCYAPSGSAGTCLCNQ